MDSNQTSFIDELKKYHLALVFIVVSLGGMIAIAFLLMHAAGNDNDAKVQAATSIFNAFLPLIGTWIGAILAYYFGTKQAQETQKQQEKTMDIIQGQMLEISALAKSPKP